MPEPAVLVRCEAVVFDLDDTLLDHRGAARAALRAWVTAWRTVEPFDTLEQRWRELESHFYERFQAREMTLQEQRRARVRAFLVDLPSDDDAADEAFNAYWQAYRANWRAFPDAQDALRRTLATGVKVGVFTNGDRELQEAKMHAIGLDINGIVFAASSEFNASKPAVEAYNEMADRLGVCDPSTCAMVGDSWVNDIQGARDAGWQAVFLDRYETRPDLTQVPRIRSLASLRVEHPASDAKPCADPQT